MILRTVGCLGIALVSLALSCPVPAAEEAEAALQTEKDWVDGRWQETEMGQFLGAAIQTPRKTTYKGIAVKIGDTGEATVCFDTDLLRYSAVWTGGFLKTDARRYGLIAAPAPEGPVQFTTDFIPGWASGGSFADPRALKLGPLPRDWAKYKGLHLAGNRVVFRYSVGATEVLDSPWFEPGEVPLFTRTLNIGNTTESLLLRIVDEPGAKATVSAETGIALLTLPDGVIMVGVAGTGVELIANGSAVNLRLSPDARKCKVSIARGARADLPNFATAVKNSVVEDLARYTEGGPARWTPAIEMKGSIDRSRNALAIDTIPVPYENPWKAMMFTSAHDFFGNGDAAVATIHGDVWRVSGIDEKLERVTWKRFATGLYQPLGLKIVNEKIYVLERDQITILHDRDGNGEADYHENFNNDCPSAGEGHAYTTSLECDSQGNFYFTKCAENTPYGGTVLRVSADGGKLDVIATGFRNPNGMGIGPGDVITVADQQGNWVPETRLDIVRPGGFYGYMPMHQRSAAPKNYDPPLTWLPRALDPSAGGQVWIPENHWGPLAGQMIHLSYGRCAMMLVLRDRENPAQGAEVSLPGRFLSGVMRGRFNPKDGHLYLTGLRGWQTAAVRDGCLQRVRHTGQPLYLPVNYTVRTNGIEIEFSQKLDRSTAEDLSSYSGQQWNYRWSEKYGSPDISAADPRKEQRDPVQIATARLQPDGKSVFLEIPTLGPVMQLSIAYSLEADDGTELKSRFFTTIHQLGN